MIDHDKLIYIGGLPFSGEKSGGLDQGKEKFEWSRLAREKGEREKYDCIVKNNN